MAVLYMRPTSDIYVNHTMYPEGSTSAYALLNEAVSDGSSTYIGVSSSQDVYTTKSSAFMFSGENISLPCKDCVVEKITVLFDDSPASTYTSAVVTCQLEYDGVIQVSNLGTSTAALSSVHLSEMTFNTNNLENKFTEYYRANGKLPNVKMILTTHATSTKGTATYGITQLYIKVEYHLNTYVKSKNKYVSTSGFIITTTYKNEWNGIGRVYKKVNGTWVDTTSNGRSQVTDHLNKLGHDIETLEYKAPTCGSTGLTEGCKCYKCKNILVAQEVIPITGSHTPTDTSASSATCGKDGYTAGTKCSVCGLQLSGKEVIPATGAHTVVSFDATDPTCGSVGYTAGTRCSTCNTYLSGHETIPATGNHTPTDVAATEPTCGAAGYTAGTRCSTCSTYLFGHETIPATGNHTPYVTEDGIIATAYDMGLSNSTCCSVCGKTLIARRALYVGAAHEHKPVTVAGYAPTCVSQGLTDGQKCSLCGQILVGQEEIAATGVHTPTTVAGYAATCTSTGLTNGQKCSVCGVTLVAQEVIPIKAHNLVVAGEYHVCWDCGYIEELNIAVSNPTPLSVSRYGLSATTVGNYAIFGGGQGDGGTATDATDAYDNSLTKTSISALQSDHYNYRNAATTVGNYALFGGGANGGSSTGSTYGSVEVTAYSTSLSRTYPENLIEETTRLAATTVGNYAIFGGGQNQNDIFSGNNKYWVSGVTAYNTSLTKSTCTNLSSERSGLAATTVGNYALFGGGIRDGAVSNIVDTYNASLTKGVATALSTARDDLAATSINGYAIFAGGRNGGDVNTIDVYNSSLTKVSVSALSAARDKLSATTVGDFALFSGTEGTNCIDIYDKNLTKLPPRKMTSARCLLAATSVGNYALFGGGTTNGESNGYTGMIDCVTITRK